ncbi:unnamed protein product [Cunninghamella echinulata]
MKENDSEELVKGTAEIFGTELADGVEYTFTGRKAAVYTWHGCTLEISFLLFKIIHIYI